MNVIRAYEICELHGLAGFKVRRIYRKTPVKIQDNTSNVRKISEA